MQRRQLSQLGAAHRHVARVVRVVERLDEASLKVQELPRGRRQQHAVWVERHKLLAAHHHHVGRPRGLRGEGALFEREGGGEPKPAREVVVVARAAAQVPTAHLHTKRAHGAQRAHRAAAAAAAAGDADDGRVVWIRERPPAAAAAALAAAAAACGGSACDAAVPAVAW